MVSRRSSGSTKRLAEPLTARGWSLLLFAVTLTVATGCVRAPFAVIVEGCSPNVISCREEAHGCYVPVDLRPEDRDFSCVVRDAWSSFLVGIDASNLWETARTQPDTFRCAWVGPYGSRAWALASVQRRDSAAEGTLQIQGPSGVRESRSLSLTKDAFRQLIDAAFEATRTRQPKERLYVIGHTGTASILIEAVHNGRYAALDASFPRDQELATAAVAFCASVPESAGVFELIKNSPLRAD